MKTIERATQEIAAGKLWRAKEILGGSLNTYPYNPELYAAYGKLLLRMGDTREAGKFLFLAGRNEEHHLEAIQIYLSGLKAAHKNQFYSSFPMRARLGKVSEYPVAVADELKRRGFNETIRHPSAPQQHEPLKSKITEILVSAIFLIAFVSAVVSAIKLISYGWQEIHEWMRS